MSFSNDIARFTKGAEEKAERVFRGTALSLFSKVILRTPVGNPRLWKNPKGAPKGYVGGRLRGNWNVRINKAPTRVTKTIDKSGAIATRKIMTAISKLKLGQSIYLVNNLPYAQAVEHGHSRRQAPKGMVAVTIRSFQRLVRAQARKARKR